MGGAPRAPRATRVTARSRPHTAWGCGRARGHTPQCTEPENNAGLRRRPPARRLAPSSCLGCVPDPLRATQALVPLPSCSPARGVGDGSLATAGRLRRGALPTWSSPAPACLAPDARQSWVSPGGWQSTSQPLILSMDTSPNTPTKRERCPSYVSPPKFKTQKTNN